MEVETVYPCTMPLVNPRAEARHPGLHASDIYGEVAKDQFPRWFGQREKDPEGFDAQVSHFTRGEIHEAAWGQAMHTMLSGLFEVPTSRYVFSHGHYLDEAGMAEALASGVAAPTGGVWCSPDGYTPPVAECEDTLSWPEDYPALVAPSIHECKMTQKSGNQQTSDIRHDKFITWRWQVMMYCYAFECHVAYLHVFYQMGDYKGQPKTSAAGVHKLTFSDRELVEHWERMKEAAQARGLWDV